MEHMKTIHGATVLEEKIKIFTDLANLAADFNYTAKTYAKIVSLKINILSQGVFAGL